jgi:hypothetical protein
MTVKFRVERNVLTLQNNGRKRRDFSAELPILRNR